MQELGKEEIKVKFTHSVRTVVDPNHKWVDRMDHYMQISSHYERVYRE